MWLVQASLSLFPAYEISVTETAATLVSPRVSAVSGREAASWTHCPLVSGRSRETPDTAAVGAGNKHLYLLSASRCGSSRCPSSDASTVAWTPAGQRRAARLPPSGTSASSLRDDAPHGNLPVLEWQTPPPRGRCPLPAARRDGIAWLASLCRGAVARVLFDGAQRAEVYGAL